MKNFTSWQCNIIIILFVVIFESQAGIFSKRKMRLKRGIQVDNCSPLPKEDPLKIRDLDIFTTKEGEFDVAAKLHVSRELNSSLKASISLQRRVLGYVWVPVPCIRGSGACDIPDICKYGSIEDEDCPPNYDIYDVPCRCPIQPGNYELPAGQFLFGAAEAVAFLASGTYHAKVELTENGQHVGCYNATFKLE